MINIYNKLKYFFAIPGPPGLRWLGGDTDCWLGCHLSPPRAKRREEPEPERGKRSGSQSQGLESWYQVTIPSVVTTDRN